MNEYALLALIWGTIFALEAAFPFILEGRWSRQRLGANFVLLAANALIGFIFGPLSATILERNARAFAGLNGSIENFFRIILILVLFDGWMYLWHRLNHRVPFFWRFHQVHHSDVRLDTTTTFRFHPGEIFLSNIFNLFAFAGLGLGLQELLIYKAVFWVVIIFHHSNTAFPLKVDLCLRTMIITPFLHRIHHSPLRRETDSNYGSVFSFWDKIFRSYRLRDPASGVTFGLDTVGTGRDLTVTEVLLLPWRNP